MAKVKKAPAFLTQLKSALVDALQANGIQAKVDAEPVPTTRLYRVIVVAPRFEAMTHSERQSLVWRIAERTLSPDDQLRISMILTLTRDEAQGK
ncbi:MAG: hypothetical protein JXQ73_15445 [Phycisphaerae bacterium]|nr:hypothetical protein [Phycisphaerae bacterium]